MTRNDVCNGDGFVTIPWIIIDKVYDALFISVKLETNDSFWSVRFESPEEDFCGGVDDEGRSVHDGGIPSGECKGGGLVDEHTDTSELVVTDKTLVLGVPGVKNSKITFRHKMILILSLKSFLLLINQLPPYLILISFHIYFYIMKNNQR